MPVSASASSQLDEYLPASLTFLIANFQSFITIRLDSSNYFAWKSQVENALKANSLFEFADGSFVIPTPETQDATRNKIPNPSFERWQTTDRMLLSCLMATLTSSILPHVVGSHHTFQLWTKLEEKFSILSRTHILDLKKRLYSLKKTTSMEKYVDSVKAIVQKLEASGSAMDDGEIVFHTVNGLPEDYLSLKQTIRTQCATTPLSFSAVSAMLMSEDLYLDHSSDASSSSTILLTQHQGSISQGSVGQGSTTAVHTSGPHNPMIASSASSFQYPMQFGPQAPQFGSSSSPMQMPNFNSSFGPNNFSGHRNGFGFNRNQNRPRGPSFSKNSFPMDFPFPTGSCQICGRFNHQASTCYYRQNLGYRPPSFGYNSQFLPHGQGFGQFGSSPGQGYPFPPGQGYPSPHGHGYPSSHAQGFSSPRPHALMLTASTAPSSHSGTSCSGAPYFGSGYPSGFGSEYASMSSFGQSGAGPSISGDQGSSSSGPWFFDSGATAHVTNNGSHIIAPSTTPPPPTVAVGNGQTISVTHSGQTYPPSVTSGALPPGSLSPSAFF